ncbi:alpha/beta hydrolase [Streptococcus oricebi]|uniref:Alpha/beta hydrolase n=2 Tax=Streptococcus oricebi TaxID=1547447 RepID=A0ABS5B217_9STRE|nr:alpha/beta hydrolase [Streptococcus oricebi]
MASYPAESRAQASLKAGKAQENSQSFVFKGDPKKPAFILYPGALVDPVSYAQLAQDLAKEGYSSYIIRPFLHLPVLSSQAALDLIKKEGLKPQQVYLAGHSLGGVVASSNSLKLMEQKQGPKGLVLLASYPAASNDLSQSQLPVLSLTASQDKIINWTNYQAAKKRLPKDSQYIEIPGGNHSGFGLYGQQAGDGQPTISNLDQQKAISKAILDFIKSQD